MVRKSTRVPRASFAVTILDDPDFIDLTEERGGWTVVGHFFALVVAARNQENAGVFPSVKIAAKSSRNTAEKLLKSVRKVGEICLRNGTEPWFYLAEDGRLVIRNFNKWHDFDGHGGMREGAGRPKSSGIQEGIKTRPSVSVPVSNKKGARASGGGKRASEPDHGPCQATETAAAVETVDGSGPTIDHAGANPARRIEACTDATASATNRAEESGRQCRRNKAPVIDSHPETVTTAGENPARGIDPGDPPLGAHGCGAGNAPQPGGETRSAGIDPTEGAVEPEFGTPSAAPLSTGGPPVVNRTGAPVGPFDELVEDPHPSDLEDASSAVNAPDDEPTPETSSSPEGDQGDPDGTVFYHQDGEVEREHHPRLVIDHAAGLQRLANFHDDGERGTHYHQVDAYDPAGGGSSRWKHMASQIVAEYPEERQGLRGEANTAVAEALELLFVRGVTDSYRFLLDQTRAFAAAVKGREQWCKEAVRWFRGEGWAGTPAQWRLIGQDNRQKPAPLSADELLAKDKKQREVQA